MDVIDANLLKVLIKYKAKTQSEMFKRLNDKRIENITGKLRGSISKLEVKINGSDISVRYKGPFYAKFIDSRKPAYINFKGFKKLPTYFLDPLRNYRDMIDELKKKFAESVSLEIKNIIKK